jgi:hypothetical protein
MEASIDVFTLPPLGEDAMPSEGTEIGRKDK